MIMKNFKLCLLLLLLALMITSMSACSTPAAQNGTDGSNGVDGKSAYELAVEKGYTGSVDEWLASLVGAKGDKGNDGETPYIEDGYWWIGGTNTHVKAEGEDGTNGTNGVSVVNAYVDDELHLRIVLSNGTEIDAGYVGTSTSEPAPEPEPEITEPTIVVSDANASAGSEHVEITVALKNNPGVTSLLMKIAFDDTALDLVSMTYNAAIGGTGIPNASTTSPITAYWADGFNDVNGDWTFVTLVFNVSAAASAAEYDITVTYNADDIYDENETNIDFDIINGKITVS